MRTGEWLHRAAELLVEVLAVRPPPKSAENVHIARDACVERLSEYIAALCGVDIGDCPVESLLPAQPVPKEWKIAGALSEQRYWGAPLRSSAVPDAPLQMHSLSPGMVQMLLRFWR